jgi:hypothetical protein
LFCFSGSEIFRALQLSAISRTDAMARAIRANLRRS